MGTGIAKAADGFTAVAPKVRATVLDSSAHGLITFKVPITDALAGAILRGKADHIIVSFSGEEARALKAVK
jgi:hypothetical protein